MRGYGTLLAAAAGLAGCAGISVEVHREPGADLAAPKTFAWMPEQDTGAEGSRVDREHVYAALTGAIAESLVAAGWSPAPQGAAPDYHVAFQVDFEHHVYTSAFPEYAHSGWSWRGFHGHPIDHDVMVTEYDVGTLVVDLVAAGTGRLSWRGIARSEVDAEAPRDRKTKLAREAVGKVFAGFPGR